MSSPAALSDTTVVVVPRQRFSMTRITLERFASNTPSAARVVYVDGGSPGSVRRYLRDRRCDRDFTDFTLVCTDHDLAPNEARNLGARHARGRYVVFLDNDVLVAPGWLEALVACAEETGAWVVGPLVCIGEPAFRTVHIAGGSVDLTPGPSGFRLVDRHRFSDRPLAEVGASLRRESCGFVEFHCMLVRRDVLDRLGPLDERLLSAAEHLDWCLSVRRAGGTVYFEPRGMVNYLPARRLAPRDVGFYMLRWSDRWNRSSLTHLQAKWSLASDDAFLRGHYMWLTSKRMLVLGPGWSLARHLLGWRRSLRLGQMFERIVTRPIISPAERRRARAIAVATAGLTLETETAGRTSWNQLFASPGDVALSTPHHAPPALASPPMPAATPARE